MMPKYQFKCEPLTQAEATRLANTCETPLERLIIWTIEARSHCCNVRVEVQATLSTEDEGRVNGTVTSARRGGRVGR